MPAPPDRRPLTPTHPRPPRPSPERRPRHRLARGITWLSIGLGLAWAWWALARDLPSGPAPLGPHDHFVSVLGLRTHYLVRGKGPPVVLIHGAGPTNVHTWRWVMPALSSYFTVYAVDLMGSGDTDKPEGDYTLSSLVEFLGAFLGAVEIPAAALVAHAAGCEVALGLALRQPERVRGLTLINPTGFTPLPSLERFLTVPGVGEAAALVADRRAARLLIPRGYGKREALNPATVDEYARTWLAPGGLEAHLARLRAYLQTRTILETSVDILREPTLLIWGDADPDLPPAAGERLRRRIPGARLVVVRGAGRAPHEENPGIVNPLLLEFLRSLPVPPTASPTAPDGADGEEDVP